MQLFPLTALLCAALSSAAPILPDVTRLVYEFPVGTWIENLVVRPSGSLLLTLITTPDLYLLNPFSPSPKPELVHRFSSNTWLTGITEAAPDTYYVIGANATIKNLSPAPNSTHIWRVQFPNEVHNKTDQAPDISLLTTIEPPVFLNGLITFNKNTLLASDSKTGAVWTIDLTTGKAQITIRDPLMAFPPTAPVPLGINGIKLYKDTLYFTSSAQSLFVGLPIAQGANGSVIATGPAKIILQKSPGNFFDDFALDEYGNAFIAYSTADSILEVDTNGDQKIVAGRVNTTEIAEPTAAQFGRTEWDKGVLYVTTAGGLAAPVAGNITVGGQVVAVDTRSM